MVFMEKNSWLVLVYVSYFPPKMYCEKKKKFKCHSYSHSSLPFQNSNEGKWCSFPHKPDGLRSRVTLEQLSCSKLACSNANSNHPRLSLSLTITKSTPLIVFIEVL